MSKKVETRIYMTRKFEEDLHKRLRVLAAEKQITMEEAHNMAMRSGLEVEEAKLVLQRGKLF